MMRFRLSKDEFKKYLQDYFNCEYSKEEDGFYEEHWRRYLNGTHYRQADSFFIAANDENTEFEIKVEPYGQSFIYKPDTLGWSRTLTLPEYIIKKEKERVEKSTVINSTSTADCINSTWPVVASSVSTTAMSYNVCDTISTKADKDYVDASILEAKDYVDVSIVEAKEYMDERIRGIENLWEELTIAGDPFLSMNKDKIIFKNNTYIDVKRKEENNMFNFDFGPCKDSNIKMSTYGLAVKDAAGKWVSYDKANDSIVDVSPLTFGDGKYFYKMPVAIKDIKVGDVIIHEKRPMFVCKTFEDGDLNIVDIMSAERKVIMPVKNMFGFNYYIRVISLMDMGGEAVQPSEDNPFGNPMMFALLANEGGFDKLDPMMMFALMSGMGGNMKDMNPMMLAMMLSK